MRGYKVADLEQSLYQYYFKKLFISVDDGPWSTVYRPQKKITVVYGPPTVDRHHATFARWRPLRLNNNSARKIINKLMAVVPATLPKKYTKLPNCSHSISTR